MSPSQVQTQVSDSSTSRVHGEEMGESWPPLPPIWVGDKEEQEQEGWANSPRWEWHQLFIQKCHAKGRENQPHLWADSFPHGFSWGSEDKVWGSVGTQEEAACLISSSLNNKGPSLPPSLSLLKFKFTFFQMGGTFS